VDLKDAPADGAVSICRRALLNVRTKLLRGNRHRTGLVGSSIGGTHADLTRSPSRFLSGHAAGGVAGGVGPLIVGKRRRVNALDHLPPAMNGAPLQSSAAESNGFEGCERHPEGFEQGTLRTSGYHCHQTHLTRSPGEGSSCGTGPIRRSGAPTVPTAAEGRLPH
jgi:hypothetical protein